jgi:hypothetical protein
MVVFDIVIPVGPNDESVIERMIEHTKRNIVGYQNIYIISTNPDLVIDGCMTINDNWFPFTKSSINDMIKSGNRSGWYLQQLIKLYAGQIIAGLSDYYLVIDSDTFFLKPTEFFYNGLPLYNIGTEYVRSYFEHMTKLHPTLSKLSPHSGICHHMMFNQTVIRGLFKLIEDYHDGTPFWRVFLLSVDPAHVKGAGASEYEIYFNYLHRYQPTQFLLRPLKWANAAEPFKNTGHDYLSCHWYVRKIREPLLREDDSYNVIGVLLSKEST